ncbi:sigma-70 family RNA polymerase sigma factor [Microbacterium sp. GXF7504]
MTSRTDRNRLIEENLPLVGFLAADVHARATHLAHEDLAAVGALALVQAADAFDPSLGVPFGAYARRRILGAFADEMRSLDWASRGIRKRIKETTAVRDTLTAALGRTPSVREIATTMGVPEEQVTEALTDAARTVTTIDDPTARETPSAMELPEETAEAAERRRILAAAVDALPSRMRLIVKAVYVDERPVKEVAEQLGVSHSAVSQQRSEAIRLMRDALETFFGEGAAPPATSRASVAVRTAFLERVADALGRELPAVRTERAAEFAISG